MRLSPPRPFSRPLTQNAAVFVVSTGPMPAPPALSHCEILGVNGAAPDEQIKARRKLALKFHPDKHIASSPEEKGKAETAFLGGETAHTI